MAARSPRLRFSTPFVITMAAAIPLATACTVQKTSNPPGPHRNPPGPTEVASDDPHAGHEGHDGHGDHRPPTQNPPGTDPASPNTNPPTQNPPTQQDPQPTWNPPPPTPNPGGGKPPTQHPPGTHPPTTDPAPTPQQSLPTHAATWTIARHGDKCTAALPVKCPEPATPGGPRPTCNPPPPMAFACPPQMPETSKVTVTRKQGETDCTVSDYFPDCPANAKCAKKPSYRTACPSR